MFIILVLNSGKEMCKFMFRFCYNSNHHFLKQQTPPKSEGSQNNSSVNTKTIPLTVCVFLCFFTGIKGPILPNFIYFLFVLYIQVPCVREKFKEESKLSKESIIKISLFTMRIFAHTYHFFSLLCEEEWKRKTEFFFLF